MNVVARLYCTNRRVKPPSIGATQWIPRFGMGAILRTFLNNSELAGVSGLWHLSTVSDEVFQMAAELRDMVDQAGLPVPAVRKVLGAGPSDGIGL